MQITDVTSMSAGDGDGDGGSGSDGDDDDEPGLDPEAGMSTAAVKVKL